MEKFAVGAVVLVAFPFSNLKGLKVRPALILAQVEFENLILCQITSKPYSSTSAICIQKSDFVEGTLPVTSFIRPDKLFTADVSIIRSRAGKLNDKTTHLALQQVRNLFVTP